MDKCPFCETRKALKQAEQLLENLPVINSKLYDDRIAELINDLGSANSLFMCYCPDEIPFTSPTPATSEDDTAAYHGQEWAVCRQ